MLLLGAVFSFFLLIARLLDLLRPRRLYHQLREHAEQSIEQVYPLGYGDAQAVEVGQLPPVDQTVPYNGENGVFSAVDLRRMIRTATAADVVLEVQPRIGEYLWRGEPVLVVRGGELGARREAALSAVIVAEERTVTQDPAYAIRTIVDIALRALSPAINDPTTAMEAVDVLESLLLTLAGRDLGSGQLRDRNGDLRVIYPAPNWPELLDLALTEIRHFGGGAHQITRRLRALLNDLLLRAPAGRHEAVRAHLALLDSTILRRFPDPGERALASRADHTGIGGRTDRRPPTR